jgi:hypothetical protein
MAKITGYPGTMYVILEADSSPPKYQGRLDMGDLPIGEQIVRVAEYKLVRQVEVRREVVVRNEIG